MELDAAVLRRARLARDARFDGRYFVGVRTTGIYCRPVCPALPPKEENVRYFHSAAEAAGEGFRPCLRCRPEASPGTPAWLGTSVTVSRALRLIADSALDDGRVEELSERLGVGPRHLRRLFVQHLGASPIAVAQTRRLQFAKSLIDETDLPLTRVAFAAGYGSVRRFNATFRKVYGRSPSELRRRGRRGCTKMPAGHYIFRLAYRPPYDWEPLIEFLSLRATPGVEAVTPDSYRRTIALGGHKGTIDVRPIKREDALEVRVVFPDPTALFQIIERVRRIFDLGADPEEIERHLRTDPQLGPLLAAWPGQRVPGGWSGFELGVRAILGQQVSVKGATTLAGRLAARFGEPHQAGDGLDLISPTPEKLAGEDLSVIGLPKARARAIQELAKAVSSGGISFEAGSASDLGERLREVPGIGEWTAQYVLMRALGEPDAFPSSDLGLLRAVSAGGEKPTPRQLEAMAENWRPWRAYAAMYLWRSGRKQ